MPVRAPIIRGKLAEKLRQFAEILGCHDVSTTEGYTKYRQDLIRFRRNGHGQTNDNGVNALGDPVNPFNVGKLIDRLRGL